MSELREVFNNREIAIGIWFTLAITFSAFTKTVRQSLKPVLLLLFCRKFVVFYIIFLSYFGLVIYGLYAIGFWDISLLKDTVFWVLFLELPLFAKTITNAKDNYFFERLIKENTRLIVIIDFVLNYWTFGLITEIITFPVILFTGLLYVASERKQEYHRVKRLFELIYFIWGVVLIKNIFVHIVRTPNEIVNIDALKSFILPILLLILNIPIVYGLAIYNTYEQVFILVKGSKSQKPKIKLKIFRFAGLNLSKITAVRNNSAQTLMISLTATDMKINLDKLEKRLSMQIGENYMKRTRFYIIFCIFGMLVCIVGLMLSNSSVSLKELLAFNFILDIPRIKEIITYICSTGITVLFCFLIYSIGLQKKKYEEISKVKKYSLYDLFYLIKRQYNLLQEFPPIDAPKELFLLYITTAYELKSECDRSILIYENLLTRWELNRIKELQLSISTLIHSIGISEAEIIRYAPDDFNSYFENKKSTSLQNDQINIFIHEVQNGICEYTEQIKLCTKEFKHYIQI